MIIFDTPGYKTGKHIKPHAWRQGIERKNALILGGKANTRTRIQDRKA